MKIKFRNAFFVFLTIGMILIGSPLYGEQTPQDPCDMKRLPASIREILQKKFSTWRFLTLKELSKEDQLFWTRSGKQNECPGMAFGHYEVQTAFSYVLSLVPQIGRSTGYRLVMFSPGEKNKYQEDVLEKEDGLSNLLVVYTVPPGKYWNDERTKSIQLFMAGFQSEEKEKGAYLYFWEGGSLRRWTISE